MVKKKGNYRQCWSYLKECKPYFFIIFLIFLMTILIGFFFPIFFQDYILNLIKKLSEQSSGMNFIQLFSYIFKNNLTTAFISLFSGIVLGISPLITVLLNGYLLGFVSGKVVDSVGYLSLIRLLPHGIFEIPALIISLGLGLKMGMWIFSDNIKKQISYDFENSMRVFIFIVLPLLLVAGLIEAGLIIIFG